MRHSVLVTAALLAAGFAGVAAPQAVSAAAASTCQALVFCDSFEDQTGSVPTGRWQVTAQNCSGTGTVAVDDTVAHTGTRSIRVTGADGYCNHIFLDDPTDMSAATPVWHVRFWVMHTTPLPNAHVTFVAMNNAAANNTDLRFGGQTGALMYNRQLDDATLPDQSPVGVASSAVLPTGSWQCVEMAVNGSNGQITTWLNGTQVAGLTEDGVPTQNIDDQWLAGSGASWRPRLTDLRFGWESYGGGGPDTLWFDDVALSTGSIGCS